MNRLLRFQNTYDKVNLELSEQIGLSKEAKEQLRIYEGVPQALFESTLGLAKIYPHKKKIFIADSIDPNIKGLLFELAKEGFQIQSITLDNINKFDFQSDLDGETLAIIFPEDDPVFGIKHPTDQLKNIEASLKIFTVKVSYNRHRLNDQLELPSKYELNLNVFRGDAVVGLLGARAKIQPIAVKLLDWSTFKFQFTDFPQITEAKDKIIRFEREFNSTYPLAFIDEGSRIYDRAILIFPDMDGKAIVDLLEEKNQGYAPKNSNIVLETTSMSYWGGLDTMNWLKNLGLNENEIRGSVIVDGNVISEQFSKLLKSVINEVRELQGQNKV